MDSEETKSQKRGPGRPPKSGAAAVSNLMSKKCPDCDEVCRTGIMLQRHITKHHPHKLKIYICKLCEDSYNEQNELFKHVMSHWSPNTICPLSEECNSKILFTRSATVHTHLVNKHSKKEESIPNEPISKNDRNSNKMVHSCSFCSKTFPKHCLLERHVRIHTGEKPFCCGFCNSSFNQKSVLKTHILSHMNCQLYKCPQCVATFNQRSNLRKHQKLSHPIVVPHDYVKCPHCPSVFSKKRYLTIHLSKFHQNLTDDQIINITVDDVMKNLLSLNEHSHSNPAVLQKSVYREESSLLMESSIPKFSHIDNLKNVPVSNLNRCEICLKNYENNIDLIKHNRKYHENKFKTNFKNFDSDQYSDGNIERSEVVSISTIVPNIDFIYNDNHCSTTLNTKENLNKETYKYDVIPMQTFADIVTDSSLQNPVQLLNQDLNIENDENNLQFDLNSSDLSLMNRSGIDADISLFCNNSILNVNENFGIENIQLDSSIFTNLSFNQLNESGTENDNFLSETNENKKSFDQCDTSDYVDIKYSIPINVNENNLITTDGVISNDINFEIDSSNVKNSLSDYISNNIIKQNTLSDNDIPPYIVSNSELTIEETNQILSGISENDNLNENIIDEDIIQVMNENSILLNENGDNNIQVNEQQEEDENSKLKSDLKILKDVLKLSKKNVFKDPPLNNRCEVCLASFAKNSDLIRHKRIHTGEKPYVCNVCNKSFSLKSSLKYHEQTHMSVRNKFSCRICGNLYSSKSALSLHKSIHLGKRSFKCPFCPMTFRTPGHRDSHLKLHFKNRGAAKGKNKNRLMDSIIE